MTLDLGNRLVGESINFKFFSNGTDGLPYTLSGTPVLSLYTSATTSCVTTTGVALTADYSSYTGCNSVVVTTTNTAVYKPGLDYDLVLTSGTVNGGSVVGVPVAHFYVPDEIEYGIVCRGTLTANSRTTDGTLGTVVSGALTNCAAEHILAPDGIPPRILKTFDSSTGSWTVQTAFVSSVSGVKCRVFGTAPADSTFPSYATIADVATGARIETSVTSLLGQFPSGFSAGYLSKVTTVNAVTGGATATLLETSVTSILGQFPSGFSAVLPSTKSNVAAVTTTLAALLPASLTTSGNMKSDIRAISGTTVSGNGGTSPWGPA
jgi:hypothetical protein